MVTLEKEIERKFVNACKRKGWKAIKFDVERDAPDRIVLIPGGQIFFIEVKRPGAKPRPGQELYLAKLREMGFQASWFDDHVAAMEWIEHEICPS